MNMIPLFVSWVLLASVVGGLAFYRKMIASKEDDFIHVDSSQAITQQQEIAKKLEAIDKWGKLLTIIAAVYTVILLGVFLYNGWNDSAHISQ